MFSDLQALHVQENINVENFGISYGSIYGKQLIQTPTLINSGTFTSSYFKDNFFGVGPNDTRTVSFNLLSCSLIKFFCNGSSSCLKYFSSDFF
jgi:hypothetical protein